MRLSADLPRSATSQLAHGHTEPRLMANAEIASAYSCCNTLLNNKGDDNYWIIGGETGLLINLCDRNPFILGDVKRRRSTPPSLPPMKYATHLRPYRRPGRPSSSWPPQTTPRHASAPRRSPSRSRRWPPLMIRLTRRRLILVRKERRRKNISDTNARSCLRIKIRALAPFFFPGRMLEMSRD